MPVTINVDQEKCKKDGLCALVCPARVITFSKQEYPTFNNDVECSICGQCIAICPSDALNHSKFDKSRFSPFTKTTVAPEEFLHFIRSRRSVRNYKDEPVTKELLQKVFESAGYAPTGAHGGHGWVRNVIAVTGKENMQKVRELAIEYMKQISKLLGGYMLKVVSKLSPEANAAVTLVLPDTKMRLREYEAGRDAITYKAPAAFFIHAPIESTDSKTDSDAAMMNIMLSAHALGLGTCWNGYLTLAAAGYKVKSFTALRDFLKVPEGHDVYAAATIGFPKIHLHSIPQRETKITWIE